MRYLILVAIMAISMTAKADLCTMQLQEEANVFEVSCVLDLSSCSVSGYFTHPKLAPGYNGAVAFFQRPPKNTKDVNLSLLINTRRNGEPRVETPEGYFAAMKATEKIMLGETQSGLLYFDAITGNRTSAPDLECVPIK